LHAVVVIHATTQQEYDYNEQSYVVPSYHPHHPKLHWQQFQAPVPRKWFLASADPVVVVQAHHL
jgi:hypothetical protein